VNGELLKAAYHSLRHPAVMEVQPEQALWDHKP
jgi:hypothetical protein